MAYNSSEEEQCIKILGERFEAGQFVVRRDDATFAAMKAVVGNENGKLLSILRMFEERGIIVKANHDAETFHVFTVSDGAVQAMREIEFSRLLEKQKEADREWHEKQTKEAQDREDQRTKASQDREDERTKKAQDREDEREGRSRKSNIWIAVLVAFLTAFFGMMTGLVNHFVFTPAPATQAPANDVKPTIEPFTSPAKTKDVVEPPVTPAKKKDGK